MALRSVVAQLFATLEKKEILTKADISSILANAKRDAESLRPDPGNAAAGLVDNLARQVLNLG
jgi:hypothetical protein